jgi:hypothetical protein
LDGTKETAEVIKRSKSSLVIEPDGRQSHNGNRVNGSRIKARSSGCSGDVDQARIVSPG